MPVSFPLIAVDVGNSRVKFGRFDAVATPGTTPTPTATLDLAGRDWPTAKLSEWLDGQASAPSSARWAANSKEVNAKHFAWRIGSVNRPTTARLCAFLAEHGEADVRLLAAGDLPLEIRLAAAERVGMDRLLGAVAANHLRAADRAAVVIDLGTAITVDLVSADGAFLGGAILPGIALSARALHDYTDQLPMIDMQELAAAPPALGVSTDAALRSGLFWGAVGAMRELVARLSETVGHAPEVFLTGGAAPSVAPLLGSQARHEPHLVLAGTALACQ